MSAYIPAMRPHPHQDRARQKMRGRRAFALLMSMRTGKTKTALDDFGEMELAGEVRDLLVLAPAGAYRVWKGEFERHASADLLDRAMLHVWETKGGVAHNEALAAFMKRQDPKVPRILLANIEATSSVPRSRELLMDFVAQRRAEVVVDESTKIKNHKAKRSKFIIDRLAPLSSYRRILSGLPTPQSPLDLFGQFSFLDGSILGHDSFFTFRNQYAVMSQIQTRTRQLIWVVKDYKNIDELYSRIEPHSIRVTLEDVVDDLPPSEWQTRHVDLTDEQRRAYDSLRENAFAELEEGGLITAQLVIVQMLRLHQLLMGFTRDSEGVLRELPENRTDALLELLEEYDGKAIVWCSYNHSVARVAAALAKRYGEDSVATFSGLNASTREEDDRRFRTNPKTRWMVATAGSGGMGRRWDVANLVVYYSSTNNLEHRYQSEERARDMTKRVPITYVDLIAPGTVDEVIIRALRKKINMSAAITGDNYREWLI